MRYNFDFRKIHKSGSIGKGKGKSKPIICIETEVKYSSLEEAAKKNKTYRSNISAVLKGRLKTAGGFHWKYDEH